MKKIQSGKDKKQIKSKIILKEFESCNDKNRLKK